MPPARETSRTTIPSPSPGRRLCSIIPGAAWLPGTGDLLVADLHFEKGSAFAARGQALLPPYDTAETIKRLEKVIARVKPERVVCMGDTLHDLAGETRMSETDRTRLGRMVARQDWVWIAGNRSRPAGRLWWHGLRRAARGKPFAASRR